VKPGWGQRWFRVWLVATAIWFCGFGLVQRNALFPTDQVADCNKLGEEASELFPRGEKGECLARVRKKQKTAFRWIMAAGGSPLTEPRS